MKTTARQLLLIALAISAGSARLGADEPPDRAQIVSAVKAAKIKLTAAIEQAQQTAKEDALVEAELRPDKLRPWYQAGFLVGDQIREFQIDAVETKPPRRSRPVPEEHRAWAAELPKVREAWKISPVKAVQLAEEKLASATAFAVRCEPKNGRWSWRVRLLAGEDLMQVWIDLVSGEVIETDKIEAGPPPAAMVWDFDRTAGDLPPDWTVRQTHPTKALATWKVIADSSAPSPGGVLALTQTENFDGTYNLAIAGKPAFKDLDLTVRLKAVSGKEDQGGGPIWRCKDENNYYICRVNPLESNFRVYYVKDGTRKQLESVKVESVADRWYTIHVTMLGPKIVCQLDGKTTIEALDSTFPDAGMVGLWTKADAVTSFDDLAVSEIRGDNKPVSATEK